MGVEARIVLYARDHNSAFHAAQAAYARIEALEQSFSDYRSSSELMRLCARPHEWMSVSDDLWRILQTARAVGHASDGAFDITIGPLVRLWRESRASGRLPDPDTLAATRSLTGWNRIEFDEQRHAVRLARPGMLLDLGGIGKGDAAQQAVDILRSLGHRRCLVALAGDLAAGDSPPGRSGWAVSVAPHASISLHNQAASTSGDASQFVEIDGARYSHIVDPRTGLGSANRDQVTVIAPRGEWADALASAAYLLSPSDRHRLASQFPDAAFLITLRDETTPSVLLNASHIRWSTRPE